MLLRILKVADLESSSAQPESSDGEPASTLTSPKVDDVDNQVSGDVQAQANVNALIALDKPEMGESCHHVSFPVDLTSGR